MTTYDETIAKIGLLPESLIQEVNDFIDFLIWKSSSRDSSSWLQSNKSLKLLESDFTEYLSNLEDYENRLARGEIQW